MQEGDLGAEFLRRLKVGYDLSTDSGIVLAMTCVLAVNNIRTQGAVGNRGWQGNGCGANGWNERIFVDRYVGGGGPKPRSGNDRYENQNKVKQKTA